MNQSNCSNIHRTVVQFYSGCLCYCSIKVSTSNCSYRNASIKSSVVVYDIIVHLCHRLKHNIL